MSQENNILTDLLANASLIAQQAQNVMEPISDVKARIRNDLITENRILPIPDGTPEKPESMCAIDGARVTDHLYAADLIAAVATTGEAQFQRTTQHAITATWAGIYPHGSDMDRIAGSAMAALELQVASQAPHAVRLLDGSFLTPLVEFRKGLTSRNTTVRNEVAAIINEFNVATNLDAVLTHSSHRPVWALPKSESSTTWRDMMNHRYDTALSTTDRILATQVLQPGEVLVARPLTEWSDQHITVHNDAAAPVRDAADQLNTVIQRVAQHVTSGQLVTTYLRPHRSPGVVRVEYFQPSEGSGRYTQQIAALIQAETPTPHTIEPFAQWSADRQAKTVSSGIRALKVAVLQHLPPEERHQWGTLFNLNYRT